MKLQRKINKKNKNSKTQVVKKLDKPVKRVIAPNIPKTAVDPRKSTSIFNIENIEGIELFGDFLTTFSV